MVTVGGWKKTNFRLKIRIRPHSIAVPKIPVAISISPSVRGREIHWRLVMAGSAYSIACPRTCQVGAIATIYVFSRLKDLRPSNLQT
jgi:hypothetical protein